MLRVTLELVPYGLEGFKRRLYTLEIGNIGEKGVTITKSGKKLYSYKVRTIDEYGTKVEHGVLVKEFDRTKPAYELISIIVDKLSKGGFLKKPAW